MNIALDYDQTFTADPKLWRSFIRQAFYAGHDIRIVTARDERLDRTEFLAELERIVPVIYCRGIAKKWFCEHFTNGFVPDIWIDDRPEGITNNSAGTVEGLAEWRETRDEGPSL